MEPAKITLVAGAIGAGKTTWIRQQLSQVASSAVYLSLGTGSVPVDSTYLVAEVPGLIGLNDRQLGEFLAQTNEEPNIYIELGFYLDLASLMLPFNISDCHKVAVLPSGIDPAEWQDWADTIAIGIENQITLSQSEIWRSVLTGQVLDFPSLNTFWYELTNGAYGKVGRIKGIFDIADGRSFYFDFVAGNPQTKHTELNLDLWLDGRPNRFSGIEIVGEQLDREAIAQTLKDCCLDEQTIAYYQQQIKTSLAQQEEEAA